MEHTHTLSMIKKRPPRCFIAEAVSRGHPDKLADQIADAILDECLSQDPNSRVAIEVLLSHSHIMVAGEVSTCATYNHIMRIDDVLEQAGYKDPGFDEWAKRYLKSIHVDISQQSPDIAQSVNPSDSVLCAGDQGITIGYACNETEAMLPLEQSLALELVQRIETTREKNKEPYKRLLGPDGKVQIIIHDRLYDLSCFQSVDVLVSWQHINTIERTTVKSLLTPIIQEFFEEKKLPISSLTINPSERFVIGGPLADTGLTGRKQVIDCYGPRIPIGGGSFSGKDATKVDRTGAYLARWIAKHVVAARLADECLVKLAFSIGKGCPVISWIDCYGTEKKPLHEIATWIHAVFPFTMNEIIDTLQLRTPIFMKTAYGGHFGRECFPWEQIVYSFP